MTLSRTGIASLALLAASLIFGMVLGLVLAFGSSEPDPFEKRWAELGVPEAEFTFLGDFKRGERESIRRELRVAQVVFAEHFGAVTSNFAVHAVADLDALNRRLAELNAGELEIWFPCVGLASEGAIFVLLECPEAHGSGQILAHEYFHILQREAGVRASADNRLNWLVEGSAKYASALYNEAQGRRTLAAMRRGQQLAWSAGLLKGRRYLYDYGFLAVDRLVEGAGTEAVLEFFRLGGDQIAFESVFGMPPGVFLSSFDAYLRVAVRSFEWRVGGTVLGSDNEPAEGVRVSALVRIEGEAWPAGEDETDRHGNFELAAPGSGYTLRVSFQCPREDIAQRVYAGEWGADGFVADRDGLLDPNDKGARPFTDGERDRTGMVIELPWTRAEVVAEHCES